MVTVLNAQKDISSTITEFVVKLTTIAKLSTEMLEYANFVILDFTLMLRELAQPKIYLLQNTMDVLSGTMLSARPAQLSTTLIKMEFVSLSALTVENGILLMVPVLLAITDTSLTITLVY